MKDKSEPVHLVVVANGSNRPIREVACKIEMMVLIIAKPGQDSRAADTRQMRSTAQVWERPGR